LADGRTLIIDSAPNGKLVEQGNPIIQNKDGQLQYVKGKQALLKPGQQAQLTTSNKRVTVT
jgi:hypothetical protein